MLVQAHLALHRKHHVEGSILFRLPLSLMSPMAPAILEQQQSAVCMFCILPVLLVRLPATCARKTRQSATRHGRIAVVSNAAARLTQRAQPQPYSILSRLKKDGVSVAEFTRRPRL